VELFTVQVRKAYGIDCLKTYFDCTNFYFEIDSLKRQNNITGKTIHVADKGLNCAKNIAFSKRNGDGYLFSKSVPGLPEREKAWVLLVTSETKMTDQDVYNTYHNLWLIEESFKITKSDLDARPVFLQKEETIKGHFLICYLAVLLERIFLANTIF